MTCIVGVVHQGVVSLGGDSAGTAGWERTLRRDPKVFHVGEFVIGFTTSFRMGQLLQYSFTPPPIDAAKDLHAYMVTEFVEAARAVFKEGGFSKSKNEEESAGVFLVGVRGRLFKIDNDYQVGESLDGYDACGCGEGYALGVMHVTRGSVGCSTVERLRAALEASAHHNAGVAGPFNFVSTSVSE